MSACSIYGITLRIFLTSRVTERSLSLRLFAARIQRAVFAWISSLIFGTRAEKAAKNREKIGRI
jgi:hypothetical protein